MRPEIDADVGFDTFATDVRAGLLRQAYRLCLDWHESEDLVQATLWRIFRHWAALNDQAHLHGYARRTLINVYLASRRAVRRSCEILVDAVPESPHAESQTEERLVLVAALRRLPPSQQQIVTMRYLADLSVGQTASVLGCTAGNVTSQATRALRSLRSFMDDGVRPPLESFGRDGHATPASPRADPRPDSGCCRPCERCRLEPGR